MYRNMADTYYFVLIGQFIKNLINDMNEGRRMRGPGLRVG